MSDGGKGSFPRPIPNRKQFEENWDRIFGKHTKKEEKPICFGSYPIYQDQIEHDCFTCKFKEDCI